MDNALVPFFFIIGRPRSGTTLLRTLFDAHPNVKIPIESPLIMRLKGKFENKIKWSEADILEFYEDLVAVKDFHKWKLDLNKLKSELIKYVGDTTFKRLIEVVYLFSDSAFVKKEILLIGDKNPIYSIRIINLIKLYPEAKYIHLTRDYRAHILSMINSGLIPNDCITLAFRWKYSAKMIAKLKKKYPGNFYTIKYEDLVNDSIFHIEKLCNFLSIPFVPNVINYNKKIEPLYEEMKNEVEDRHLRVFKPIDNTKVNHWKTELSDEYIRFADATIGKWAEKEGYERMYTKPSIGVYVKIIPTIVYQKIYYSYNYFYTKLPTSIRNILLRN